MLMSIAAQAGPGNTYPLTSTPELEEVAGIMPGAETGSDGFRYHFDRYGDTGLYGISDPAERVFGSRQERFMDAYSGLGHVGNALVIVAHISEGKKS
jgi:hypothetical protein